MSEHHLRLGIDLGTSAVKVVALDENNAVAAMGSAVFPTYAEMPGQAEQDPGDWLAATATAVSEVGRQLGGNWAAQVSAVGLAGQLPTLVCMGPDGPFDRAIAWMDSRADSWASGRIDAKRRELLYQSTGMPIDGRYLAPMFRFHCHECAHPVQVILSAKDFLCYALTGQVVTDPSTAAGYGVYTLAGGGWDPALCADWDLDPALLPVVRPAQAEAGPLNAAGARLLGLPEGLPVAVGAADSVAAALAMGGANEGIVSVIMGSSTVIIDAVTSLHLDPRRRYLMTPHAVAGWYGREMDLLSTGSGFRWLGELMGWTNEELQARATASMPGANGLFFAPYLAGGEQGALWNPELRGTLHGLALHHTAADIARAFLEGVLFEIRRCVEVLAEAVPIQRIVLAGHMAASNAALGMLADILGRPIEPCLHLSPAAVGAGLLAPARVAGHHHKPCTAAILAEGAAVVPGSAAAEYQAIYRRYKALFPGAAMPPAVD
jgi:xylulokinase